MKSSISSQKSGDVQLKNSFSSLTTQREFLGYLKLTRIKQIKMKECVICIKGSKCSICKREFKCKTDTEKHIAKKHSFVMRKKDSKMIRVKFKLGKETFCVNKIDKRFLMSPNQKIDYKSFNDCQERLQIEEQKPIELSNIKHSKDICEDSVGRVSIPLSAALTDIISLDATASYKNGRVYKDDPNKYLKSGNKFLASQNKHKSIDTSSNIIVYPPSPTPSNSDSDTVLYVSDIEKDLSEFYESVKPEFSTIDLDDDSDDGEIKIIRTYNKNDFESVRQGIEQVEGAEAAFDVDSIMKVNPMVPVKPEPVPEPMDIIDLDSDIEGDIDDAETVILPNAKGVAELDTCLEDLEDEDTRDADDLQSAESIYSFTVENPRLEPRKEDQDVYIVENSEPEKPNLVDYLMDALLKYMEKCEAASRGSSNDNNNNSFGTSMQERRNRIENLKNSPKYNQHLKEALLEFGLTITPPTLIKDEPGFY